MHVARPSPSRHVGGNGRGGAGEGVPGYGRVPVFTDSGVFGHGQRPRETGVSMT